MVAVVGNLLSVRLKGANYGGYAYTAIQGFNPDDPSGAQAGQPNGPSIAAMTAPAWKLNALRLSLHESAWLGLITYDTGAVMHDADPRRNYQSSIIAKVNEATAAGQVVILDLHWSNPAAVAPMQQQQMASADHSNAFWASVANTFKSNPNVIFDPFNEPIMTYGIKSGGTGVQVMMQGGVITYLDCSGSGSAPYKQVFVAQLSNTVGYYKPGSTIVQGAITCVVNDHDLKNKKLYYSTTGSPTSLPPGYTAGAGPAVTVLKKRPMIGHGLPAFAPSAAGGWPVSGATSGNYNVPWRSTGALPQRLSIDVSSVRASIPSVGGMRAACVAWYAEDTYGFDHAPTTLGLGGTVYNCIDSYTLEGNTAASGGAAPTTGWTVLATVTGNKLNSRAHVIDLTNYNWIGINSSVGFGSPGNADIKIAVDIVDAGDCMTGARGTGTGTQIADGWFFVGDSIVAGGQTHQNVGSSGSAALGDQVFAITGHAPLSQCAGMPGWKTSDWLQDTGGGVTVLDRHLATTPLKYVPLCIGANDSAGSATPNATTYTNNMLALAAKVVALGKVPIIPTITWSPNVNRDTGNQVLNNAMATALASHPEIVVGPDLHAWSQANPTLINPVTNPDGGLHPTADGYAALRAVWAQWIANTFYAPTCTIVDPNVGWTVASYQSMINNIRATGATNVIGIGTVNYTNDLSQWLANVPTDPLNQLCCFWHPYPPTKFANGITIGAGGTGHAVNDVLTLTKPNTCYEQIKILVTAVSGGVITTAIIYTDGGNKKWSGSYLSTTANPLPTNPIAQASSTGTGVGASFNVTSYTDQFSPWSHPSHWAAVNAIGAVYPIIMSEVGEHSYPGLTTSPWITEITGFADLHSYSVLGWEWGGGLPPPSISNNRLITDVGGTPTPGYGTVYQAWAVGIPGGGGGTGTGAWLAPDWLSADWLADDWLAGAAILPPPGPVTAQLVGQQAPDTAGSSGTWLNPNWLAADWLAPDWLAKAGGGWVMTQGPGISGNISDFIIPLIPVAPAWTFRMNVGVDARIVATQAPNTALLTAQHVTLALNRAAQIAATQAPDTGALRATFTPSQTARTATLVVTQAPDTAAFVATNVTTGGTGTRRYGRR